MTEADRLRFAIYGRMTPAQKWAEFRRLSSLARNLKRAGLRAQHPEWSEEEVERTLRNIFLFATT